MFALWDNIRNMSAVKNLDPTTQVILQKCCKKRKKKLNMKLKKRMEHQNLMKINGKFMKKKKKYKKSEIIKWTLTDEDMKGLLVKTRRNYSIAL